MFFLKDNFFIFFKNGYKYRYLFFCLYIIIPFYSYSQTTVLKHYGVNQGLPSSECYFITQDSRGYMWIATDAGVVKYDGYKFNTYNTNKGLPDNTVFKIQEDKYGRIWFGSYSGKMAYYSYDTDSIYGIEANDQLSKLIKAGVVNFAFDEKDTLFISSSRAGYIKVSPPNYTNLKSYKFNMLSCFFLKELNNKQFVYGNYFTYLGKSENKMPLLFETNKHIFYDDTSFKMAGQVNYFSACRKNDTSFLFSDYKSIAQISFHSKKIVLDSLPVKNDIILTLCNDHLNRVWVNTHTNGTFLYDTLNTRNKPRRFLENHSVTSVFEDKEHGYWLSTLENGIYYIPSLKFEFIDRSPEIQFEKVYSLNVRNNKISFLTSDGFFYEIDVNTKKVLNEIKTAMSSTFLLGYDQSLLICNSKSVILDEKTGRHISLVLTSKGKKTDINVRIKKATEFDKNYLIGFYDGAVVKIEKSTGLTEVIVENLPIIFSVHVMDNVIWIGTKIGVYSYSNSVLKFYGDDNPMLKKRVDGMIHDGNKLFFATRGYGVLCYEHGKIINQYTERDGLASNLCKTILKDNAGNIWIGTNRGISRLKKESNGNYSVNTINLANGLTSSEINQIMVYQNTLYFATNKGIGIVKIEDAFNSTISIPVYVENFLVNDVKTEFNEKNIYDYNQNFIKISYKGIYAKAEGDIKYKYKLEGLDTTWTYSKNTFVQYTTLPPGNYKFIIYAINFDGKLSNVPATISFMINPPYWETWWFMFLVALVISLTIYFIYQRRVNLIQKQEREKTEFYKQIAESELKALRAQMNPHFMFNAINSIQSFVLKNDSKSAQKYLTKFARLIRSVLENSKFETISLTKEIDTLNLYMELECLRASFSFDYDLKVKENVNIDKAQIPPMLLQPYIENAILHGLMPLQDKRGFLQIDFSFENSVLKCIIEDNGIGREKAAELKAKKHASHQSMGMAVTEERMNILSKSNLFKTQALVVDKKENGIALGTRIEVYIEYLNKKG